MKKFLIIFVSAAVLFSCQKVIDVNLNEANPVIVIEAEYDATDSTVRAKVSMTTSYFESGEPILITDAQVFIVDAFGNSTPVPIGLDSTYLLTNYIPNYDTDYTLSVQYNGTTYSASSTLNSSVPQENIMVEYFPPGPFSGDGVYLPFIRFQDPATIVNYYQIISVKNGKFKDKLKDINTQDDALTDGNLIERPLFTVNYELGDTVGLELRSIDENIYNYLNQAISLEDSENSAAPGNPDSNWDNNALGYFSAYSSTYEEVIVQ